LLVTVKIPFAPFSTENLENTRELVEEFEKENKKDTEGILRMEKRDKERIFYRGELPGKFTAKKLYGWDNKRYDEEYWGKLERNWKKWKQT